MKIFDRNSNFALTAAALSGGAVTTSVEDDLMLLLS